MSNTNTGGPAFPRAPFTYIDNNNGLDWAVREQSGMTLRQYAAIKLKVPDSGADWLDDMIRESLRNEFAAHAPPAPSAWVGADPPKNHCSWRWAYADAMMKARGA